MNQQTLIRLRKELFEIMTQAEQEINKINLHLDIEESGVVNKNFYNEVMATLCELWNVTPEQIKTKDRDIDSTMRKHIFRWICVRKFRLSFTEVARLMQNNHTTIINSIKCVDHELSLVPEARNKTFQREYRPVQRYVDRIHLLHPYLNDNEFKWKRVKILTK